MPNSMAAGIGRREGGEGATKPDDQDGNKGADEESDGDDFGQQDPGPESTAGAACLWMVAAYASCG